MNTELLYHLLDRIGNLLRNEVRADLAPYGLQPIHFEALHYLSICNRFSDTPKAVTEYLGLTKGTVSQSLKVLETKGYLTKETDIEDKRVSHLVVSLQGKKLIKDIFPPPLMQRVITSSKLNVKELDVLALQNQLQSLLRSIQTESRRHTFGVCATCKHNQPLGEGRYLCGLTHMTLSARETELICIEHIE
ncbi:MarR family winged helix-turn-helix transcriptional regulator [Vibrio sagamiensis]|uniref:Transcriptional regulator n=1 Tax=Vibrio sagamiensis NBRC 104589 TaxID=1219064 RepID=A0A511QJ13_9VIBR|nr:helix-turn-helix domain-containing protein [Vibrio sagamiensis]PNQ58652.1 MarR family transcriptional regulator [Vibrio agarivorans]GEM77269.1 transcriptional regulator [Vibrio sagamiensis NBRC 104589]